MKHYTRTLILCSVAVSILLAMLAGGCAEQDHIADPDKMVGGGSIDTATGRVTVGGCVQT
jgi:hypothetical protein